MSFDRLSSLEAQPTTLRRQDDPNYSDDPEFKRFTDRLSNKLMTLTGSISRLSQQLSLLGTKKENERIRDRVSQLLEETKDGMKDAGEDVKKVQAWEDVNPSQRYAQEKLTREFKSILTEFSTVQRIAIEKQKKSADAAKQAIEDEEHRESGDSSGGQGEQQLQQQEQIRLAPQSEVDFQESLIVQREEEIRRIEEGVTELNEIFRDLGTIVNEQGVMVDNIEDNVMTLHTNTKQADVELRQASRYQRQARGRMCWLLLILALILAVVLLAVFLG